MYKHIFYLTTIFAIIFSFFYYLRELNIEGLKSRYIEESTRKLLASQSMYDTISEIFYQNENDLISEYLYRYSSEKNSTKKYEIRKELLNQYFNKYFNLSLLGLNQFQVYDNRGYSVIRFKHLKIYGDELYGYREAIKKSIDTHLFLRGFEIGKLIDGFRYIYPLFYNGKFVGGYEWSWSYASLIDELRKNYAGWYLIVLNKQALLKKMDVMIIEKNYRPLKGYPDLIYHKDNERVYSEKLKKFLQNFFVTVNPNDKIKNRKVFAEILSLEDKDYIVGFQPLKDILNKSIGYLIFINETENLREINKIFFMELLFSIIIIGLIYMFLKKSYRDKEFMRTLIDSQKDLVILTDEKDIKDANRRFLDFFEVADVKEFEKKYGCICHQFVEVETNGTNNIIQKKDDKNWIKRLLLKRDSDKRVVIFDQEKGEDRIFIVSISRFRNSPLYVVVFRDITEIEQEKHFFQKESMIDHLTRAYNKRTFEMHLINKINEVKRTNKENIALIMFDIDFFKKINDRFGHTAGDKVLIDISAVVQDRLRGNNSLYRWGGEEFAILMENIIYEQAIRYTDYLRKAIAEYEFSIGKRVTCSFGVTMIRVDDTKDSVIERVDANLYRAKSKGRNRVESDVV